MMLKLDPRTTALVLIDVQKGTLAAAAGPHEPATVIANSARLASRFSQTGATVVLVRVAFSDGYADKPGGLTDTPMVLPPGGLPADWTEFPAELGLVRPDVLITKRQWSAFHGTELDLQLRRRGVSHLVIGGLMTNFGVESTARDAWQQNYHTIIAEDASSSLSAELHQFAIRNTLPRVSRVRSTAEIIAALEA
ncbi:hydrolase [Microvirga subterranea]|uniref:Nicotinamidase-related amidase n=1 Tax=Microvirga subterranea TaxID=186651 RepID=A0A370HVH7_9HYPH|nr:hydrolase [Microvirga subterranea]RDI62498.1 nicotinamidase-related amidase [Microvirga subterranea]